MQVYDVGCEPEAAMGEAAEAMEGEEGEEGVVPNTEQVLFRKQNNSPGSQDRNLVLTILCVRNVTKAKC